MGAIYKPFGLGVGILGGIVATKIFNFIWSKFDEEEPPKATTEIASWPKLLSAAALQGIVLKLTRLLIDRYGAKGFAALTGTWPGERRPDRVS